MFGVFKYIILISVFFISLQVVKAQNNSIKFNHLGVEHGLSQSTVKCILKDSEGFMWFGTENGLNKFDAYEFSIYEYDNKDENSISNGRVTSLAEDNEGNIWVGTFLAGINKFNRETERFERYTKSKKVDGGISENSIGCVYVDKNGDLWVGTFGGGLNLYLKDSKNFKHFVKDTSKTNSIGSDFIRSIAEDSDGNLWMTNNLGDLMCFDKKKNIFTNLKYDSNYSAQSNSEPFGKMIIDSKDNIWIGTENGIYIYSIKSKTIEHLKKGSPGKSLNSNAVSGILEDENNIYWILTDHGGLNIYDRKSGTFEYIMHEPFNPQSLSNNQLYSIYKDDNENYWIGNFNGGVNVFNKKKYKFNVYTSIPGRKNSLSFSSVISLCEDRNGHIWMGTDGGGLNQFNPAKETFHHYKHDPQNNNSISSDVITSIYEDANGDLWFGTYLEGLNHFDRKKGVFNHYVNEPNDANSLAYNNIWSMTEDADNNFWIGLNGGGISVYDRHNKQFKHYMHQPGNNTSLGNDGVLSIFVDSKNDVWVGTSMSGVNKYNKEIDGFIQYSNDPENPKSLVNNRVSQFYEDSKGALWVATSGGLSKYNPEENSFTNIGKNEGLPDNVIKSMVEDDNSNLWIGTNQGLTRYNLNDKSVKTFTLNDGLPSNEFNFDAALKSKTGLLYFGGPKGVASFNPESIVENEKEPLLVFTELLIYNKKVNIGEKGSPLKKHISKTETITLSYKQSVFTIKFAALNYLNPENNQYSYKLVGFDEVWNNIGNERKATYTNLDPGVYYLKVKGSNNDGVWNEEGISISIVITPPFWLTWWFKFLVVVLILLSLYIYYRMKLSSIKQQKNVLEKTVEERTNELSETNSLLEEKNEEIVQQKEELLVQTETLAKVNLELEAKSNELLKHKNNLEGLIKERTSELEKSKLKAEESDRLKTAFLTNMSHEIRTPMNAIVGFSQLLNDPDLENENKNEFINQISANSETLLQLIDDILDISLIESDDLLIKNQNFDIIELLKEIYANGWDLKRNKDFELRLNIPDAKAVYILNSDRDRVKQVLMNLYSNACKFTDVGYVELGVIIEDASVQFYVKDTGIGISEEDLKIIFNRFRKVDAKKDKLFRGIGIGLTISKKIALLLGGDLLVESELGKGSVFKFSISREALISVEREKTVHKPKKDFNWPDKNVLIVEDEETNFLYLKNALLKTNVNVIWAENGMIALDLIKSGAKFDVVLMDIKMPILNGYDATEAIKKLVPHQVVIAQTAYARPEEKNQLLKAGFDAYLAKPVVPVKLLTKLSEYLD